MSIADIDIKTANVISTTQSQPGLLPALNVEIIFKSISRNVYMTINAITGTGASLDTTPIVLPANTVPAQFRPLPGTIVLGVVQLAPSVYGAAAYEFDASGGIIVTPLQPWTAGDAGFTNTVLCFQTL